MSGENFPAVKVLMPLNMTGKNSSFEKFRVESVDGDPAIESVGRIWYNKITDRLRYSAENPDDASQIIVHSCATLKDLEDAINGGGGGGGETFKTKNFSESLLTSEYRGRKPSWGAIRGNVYGYKFRKNKDNELHLNLKVPEDYVPGSAITPVINWTPLSSRYGTVVWKIEYTVAAPGHFLPLTKTIREEIELDGDYLLNIETRFSDDSFLDGVQKGSIIMCRIFRDGYDWDDTFNADVAGHFLGFEYLALC